MRRINIFGPVNDPTGYAESVREIVYETYLKGVSINLQKFEKWCNQKITTPLDPLISLLTQLPYNQNTPLLSFCLPEQIPLDLNNINVNYTMFEADGIPENWVDACKQIDHIIVPSKFCKDTWIKCGVPEYKISVAGLGVNPNKYFPTTPSIQLYTEDNIPLQDRYKYRVMNIQEIVERKNLDGILRCWMKSKVSKRDDSCLILKLSSYSGDKLDFFQSKIDALKSEHGASFCKNIYSYTSTLSDDLMPAFIRNATHYISMSLGEGWDLNVMKAASMCKIVCAPNSTSYTEYLTEDNSYLIPIKRKEVCNQKGPTARLYKGFNWFIPDEDYVINFLDTLGENEEKSLQKVKKFHNDIVTKWTWAHCSENISKIIDTVSESTPSRAIPKKATKKDGVVEFCKSLNPGVSRCGIANYSLTLHNSIATKYPALLVGGPDTRYLSVVDEHPDVSICHMQNEYQFHSKNRLKFLFSEINKKGLSSIITQHTITRQAIDYNDIIQKYVDLVLVHSERAKKEWDDIYGVEGSKCLSIPMGCLPLCSDVELEKSVVSDIENKDKFTIGFFGFTYYHKGIDRLILSYKALQTQHSDIHLLLLANKPVQDSVQFSERCKITCDMLGMKEGKDYTWFRDYLDELQIVKYLKKCDLIVLPYDEYGGVGTSAAIRTCLRAGVPIVTSDTCWFSDVDCIQKFDIDNLTSVLFDEYKNKDNQIMKFKRINSQKKFIEDNSFANIAQKHIDLYKKLSEK